MITESEWSEKFSETIRSKLTELNMSQKDFAKRIGYSEVTISRHLNNQRVPDITTLLSMSKVLKCNVSELCDFECSNGNSRAERIWISANDAYNLIHGELLWKETKNSKIVVLETTHGDISKELFMRDNPQ